MTWRGVFILLGALLLMGTVQGFVISNSYVPIDYTVNQRYEGFITINYDLNTTPHNFTIYNITIENIPYLNFTPISSLDINNTARLNYSVKITEPVAQEYQGIITYYYLTNTTRLEKNYTITVNSTGFNPLNSTIYQNDSIIWKNIGTVNHTVTNLNNTQDRIILPIGTIFIQKYPDIAEIQYYDEITSLGGYLYIQDNLEETYVHTPGYDVPITFNFQYNSGNIEAAIFPSSFTLDSNKKDEGVLRIKSNFTVFNLHLEADWFSFEKNDFNLEDVDLVNFIIDPINITKREQTNKTYTKTIEITGDNIFKKTIDVPIFINYANITSADDDVIIVLRPMTIKEQRAYCEEVDWDDSTCQEYIKNESYPVIKERIIRPELNESDFIEFIDAPDKIIESNDRLRSSYEESETEQNTRMDSFGDRLDNVENNLGNLTTMMSTVNGYVLNLKRNKFWGSFFFWMIITILSIVIGIWRLIVFIRSRKRISTSMGA